MRTKIIYLANLVVLVFLSLAACSKNLKKTEEIFTGQSLVNEPLKEILRLTNLNCALDLTSVVACTQKAWLRTSGLERADLEESYENVRQELWPLFQKMGVVNEIKPSGEKYDYIFVLGATYPTLKLRFDYLVAQIEKGLKTQNLILMGSMRPLIHETEIASFKTEHGKDPAPNTEIALMKQMIKLEKYKKYFSSMNIIEVSSAMKISPSGQSIRPNTKDTYVDFNRLELPPGKALTISNQPYIGRQDLVASSLLEPGFNNETIGPKASSSLNTNVFLDEIARLLFESHLVKK